MSDNQLDEKQKKPLSEAEAELVRQHPPWELERLRSLYQAQHTNTSFADWYATTKGIVADPAAQEAEPVVLDEMDGRTLILNVNRELVDAIIGRFKSELFSTGSDGQSLVLLQAGELIPVSPALLQELVSLNFVTVAVRLEQGRWRQEFRPLITNVRELIGVIETLRARCAKGPNTIKARALPSHNQRQEIISRVGTGENRDAVGRAYNLTRREIDEVVRAA
jgi:hypothetical protein